MDVLLVVWIADYRGVASFSRQQPLGNLAGFGGTEWLCGLPKFY